MLLKKVQVLPIVTDESDSFEPGDIVANDKVYPPFKIVGKDDHFTFADGYKKVHLYVFRKEQVNKGDFIFDPKEPKNVVRSKSCSVEQNKLVATTDTEIPISRISKSFISIYINCPKEDAMIVCTEINDKVVVKKTARGVVHLRYDIKEIYSRADVFEKIEQMLVEVCCDCKEKGLEWMDENL